MIPIKSRLTGLEDVQAVLFGMARGAANRVMRPAMNAGARILRDRMRSEAPVGRGAIDESGTRRKLKLLRKSIGYKTKVYKGAVVSIVGPRKGFKVIVAGRPYDPVKYAHIVENGRGVVRIKNKRVLSDGGVIYGVEVRATKPNPFMRRSFDTSESRILQVINGVATSKLVSMMV